MFPRNRKYENNCQGRQGYFIQYDNFLFFFRKKYLLRFVLFTDMLVFTFDARRFGLVSEFVFGNVVTV